MGNCLLARFSNLVFSLYLTLLADDGSPVSDPEGIRALARDFYTALFSSDPSSEDARRVLWEDLPQVGPGGAGQLDAPITSGELAGALDSLSRGKSPGLDGLTVEFFRAFWDVLGDDYAGVLGESIATGEMPLSWRRAVVALLPKKGDLRLLKNWRPVSLLSTDYKIFAKAMSSRLGTVLDRMIHPDQSYTVPGRTIHDNLTSGPGPDPPHPEGWPVERLPLSRSGEGVRQGGARVSARDSAGIRVRDAFRRPDPITVRCRRVSD